MSWASWMVAGVAVMRAQSDGLVPSALIVSRRSWPPTRAWPGPSPLRV